MEGSKVEVAGVLVPSNKGHGRLIDPARHGRSTLEDAFVPRNLLSKYRLRTGQHLVGLAQWKEEDRGDPNRPVLREVKTVDGLSAEARAHCPRFSQLTTLNPERQLKVECADGRLTTRIIDLFTPLGKGQRGLIVAPPRAGKTIILRDIAQGVEENCPSARVMVALIDERPEEVTDFKKELPKAEIYASSNDEELKRHLWIAELAIERAKNQVETGKDVVLLIDSLTRLSRAYNTAGKGGGRTLTGGLDIRALEKPRQFFSAARETEEAGSLTILASVLVETGSKMDELIFQEFKGTGNMELVLNRKCAQLRLYPAIDFNASGTRKEEKILDGPVLKKASLFRRALAPMRPVEACESLIERMEKAPNNEAFLAMMKL